MLGTSEKSRISTSVLERIRELIRSGQYSPGDQLPSERRLVSQLRVGRTSIREALRKLETMGLVEIRQGVGTFVKDPSSERIQTSLVPYIFPDKSKMEKLFELRGIIEVEAAERAAHKATPEQISAMRHWLQAAEMHIARDDMDSFVIADVEFHRQIIIATENDILVDLIDSVVDLLREMRRASPRVPELIPETIAGHRAILAAIEAGDGQAARQAMRDHLSRVRERVMPLWPERNAGRAEATRS